MSTGTLVQLEILAFLGCVALVGAGVLATVALTLAGRLRAAVWSAASAGALVALYAAALVTVGAATRSRVLPPGASKVFCEIDCHLAYTVTGAYPVPSREAHGARRWFVTVRTYFDERTTAPWRGDGLLYPNPRRARLVDATGRAWPLVETDGTPLDAPLRPGQSYETTLAFDVPSGADARALELTEADAVTRLIIGHENSPLHGKTLLTLGR